MSRLSVRLVACASLLSGGGAAAANMTCRGMRTVAQTINLARPKTCSRPAQVQTLVSADVVPCPHKDGVPTYPTTRVVRVKICRRKDLERACQPKLCDCPQKLPPKTTKEIICCATIFGAKGALAAGLVYWTVSEGIWGDGADTEDFYFRMRETFAPDESMNDEKLPRLAEMKFKIVNSYNHLILKIMDILVTKPMMASKKIRDVLFPCEPIEEEDPKKKKKK